LTSGSKTAWTGELNVHQRHADPRLLLFIQPTGYSLKPLDITVKKKLHKKVNLIPVIAKSETLTNEEIKNFKRKILAYILHQEIDIFAPPQHENIDTEPVTETHEIMSKVPLQMW
jgi:septin 7